MVLFLDYDHLSITITNYGDTFEVYHHNNINEMIQLFRKNYDNHVYDNVTVFCEQCSDQDGNEFWKEYSYDEVKNYI